MATASEAIMIELEKEGCEWIKSERFQKKQAEEAKRKEQDNPMKVSMMGGRGLFAWEGFSEFSTLYMSANSVIELWPLPITISKSPFSMNKSNSLEILMHFHLTQSSIQDCDGSP